MKYIKMLGLAAVAAMALMAFGANMASATILTSPAGTKYSGEISSSLSAGTSASLTNTAGETLNTCTTSSVTGKVENAGSSTTTVSGKSNVSFSNCSFTTHTISGGTLEIHHTSGNNGSVVSKGASVTITQAFGSCTYGTGAGKTLGTLIGGTPATLAINVVVNEQAPTSFLCPDHAVWKANYTVTKPGTLLVDVG